MPLATWQLRQSHRLGIDGVLLSVSFSVVAAGCIVASGGLQPDSTGRGVYRCHRPGRFADGLRLPDGHVLDKRN